MNDIVYIKLMLRLGKIQNWQFQNPNMDFTNCNKTI